MRLAIAVFLAWLAAGAGQAAEVPGFVERRQAAGIDFVHVSGKTDRKYLLETMGGGVAVFDADGDGLLDLFFVNGGRIETGADTPRVVRDQPGESNRLYRNLGDGAFADVTADAGLAGPASGVYGMGAATGDYDNDGDADLLVTGYPRPTLYRNDGSGVFADVTEAAGVTAPGWSSSAGFFDADSDGDLDLLIVRYLDWSFAQHIDCDQPRKVYCSPQKHPAVSSVFLRNQGDGTFRDDSRAAGISEQPGKALGVAFHDLQGDGDIDVLVANDSEAQQLFVNDGDGRFTEDALLAGLAFNEEGGSYAGMGVDWADVDNDLRPDVIITNLAKELYAYYANDGDGLFSYRTRQTQLARITARSSGWGVQLFDHDLDGQKDLFVSQSHVMESIAAIDSTLRYEEPPLLALGQDDIFEDVSSQAGPAFQQAVAGRGAAFGDLDNDGDIDIVASVLDGPPLLLYSQSADSGRRWIEFELRGSASPRDGQGALVVIETAAGPQQRLASTAGSYQSASSPRVHFGLGEDAIVRSVRILWPSGIEQQLDNVAADQLLRVAEPSR